MYFFPAFWGGKTIFFSLFQSLARITAMEHSTSWYIQSKKMKIYNSKSVSQWKKNILELPEETEIRFRYLVTHSWSNFFSFYFWGSIWWVGRNVSITYCSHPLYLWSSDMPLLGITNPRKFKDRLIERCAVHTHPIPMLHPFPMLPRTEIWILKIAELLDKSTTSILDTSFDFFFQVVYNQIISLVFQKSILMLLKWFYRDFSNLERFFFFHLFLPLEERLNWLSFLEVSIQVRTITSSILRPLSWGT